MLGKLKKRKRLNKHGFLGRGTKVLARRRSRKRRSLTVSVHSK